MKVTKTKKVSAGKVGEVRSKLPGAPSISTDERGKLAVQVKVWVPSGKGEAEELQVELTNGDIERILDTLAHPHDVESAQAVGKLMQENLRSLLRLTALGSGTALAD